ncbi:MAG TPA: response regulator [Bacteroidia bacterium]|nr:response regulator [Bacteroidia bacterium]
MEFEKPKNIFIVDDDTMTTEALKDYLTRKVPHKVTCFHTGEDCLPQLIQKPDVVILDFYMNTVQKNAANGLEVLETIKKNYPGIHIIMLSSQEKYGLALQTIQKGAEQYVIKDAEAFEKISKIIQELN